MVGILSIDFDYFIDASSQERDLYFPKRCEEIPKDVLKLLWEEKYAKYPKLKELGVIKEYYFLKEYLKALIGQRVYVFKADSHANIRKIIETIPCTEQLKIVNVDFHHDFYHYYIGENRYNCGNWLRRVIEERTDTKVKWIRREDSQLYSLEGIFPFEHTTDIESISEDEFDYVFLCRSPEWSPPHLNSKFEELPWPALREKTA